MLCYYYLVKAGVTPAIRDTKLGLLEQTAHSIHFNRFIFGTMAYMSTMHTLCYNFDAIAPTRGPGFPKYYPKWPISVSGVLRAFAAKLYRGVACLLLRTDRPYAFLLLVTFALDELAVS